MSTGLNPNDTQNESPMEKGKEMGNIPTKQESAEHYSGITIDSELDERNGNKQVKDWTKLINNNANSTPLYNPPEEMDEKETGNE